MLNCELHCSLIQELSAKNVQLTAELQKLRTAMNHVGTLQGVTSQHNDGRFNYCSVWVSDFKYIISVDVHVQQIYLVFKCKVYSVFLTRYICQR